MRGAVKLKLGLALGSLLALGVLASLTYLGYRSLSALIAATQQVAHTHLVTANLERALASVMEAESAAHSFVLAGDETHRGEYRHAVATFDLRLRHLRELAGGDRLKQELLDSLGDRTRTRLALLEETMDTRQRVGIEGTWRGPAARRGGERMEAVQRTIVALRAAAEEDLRRWSAEQARSLEATAWATMIGGGVPLLVVLLAWGLGHRSVAARELAEEALQRTAAKLGGWTGAVDQRGREVSLLGELADHLQRCRTAKDAHDLVAQFGPRLFPGSTGLLGLLNAETQVVEAAAAWGPVPGRIESFEPKACWALRTNRLHAVQDPGIDPLCRHVPADIPGRYVCAPVAAQGAPLGVLHIQEAPEDPRAGTVPTHVRESRRQLAASVAQHIGLALTNLELREGLRSQAVRDPLTDLFNRRYMEESLEREIRRARRSGAPLGILMIDIDHFKRFNDTFGHDAGDVLLREVARFLKSRVRGGDIACRYGGEEFTLILPETPLAVSTERAESIRCGVKALQVTHEDRPLGPVTVSLGVAMFPDHGDTGETVLRAADAALYQSKHGGRDRVTASA